jgi:hypothetical protein
MDRGTLFVILWACLCADSAGALLFKANGSLASWYAGAFPSLVGQFPLANNGWASVYALVSLLGLLTTLSLKGECERRRNGGA